MTAVICSWCGFVDDLAPHPQGTQSLRCPCPHDEHTARQRQREVEKRHRAAVALARGHGRRAS